MRIHPLVRFPMRGEARVLICRSPAGSEGHYVVRSCLQKGNLRSPQASMRRVSGFFTESRENQEIAFGHRRFSPILGKSRD